MGLYAWDGTKYVRIDDGAGNLDAKNKKYDSDLDNVIDLASIPNTLTGKDADTVDGKHASDIGNPPVYIKTRTDGTKIKLDLGTITTADDGQALSTKMVYDTETSYSELASYLNEYRFTNTSWQTEHNFGTLSLPSNKNELQLTKIKWQVDLCYYYRIDGWVCNTYNRLLVNGVEKASFLADGYNWETFSAEFTTDLTSASFESQVYYDPDLCYDGYRLKGDCYNNEAAIRNRYIYTKKVYYKVQIYN